MNTQEALAILGSLAPDRTRCYEAFCVLNSKDTNSRRDAIEQIKLNKVQPQSYQNLVSLSDSETAWWISELYEDWNTSQVRSEVRSRCISWIDKLSEGLNPVLLKGASLQGLYPEGTFRYANDIDVWVETMEELWELTARLRAHECEPLNAWYLSRREDLNEPWFITGHWKHVFSDNKEMEIDLHGALYTMFPLQGLRQTRFQDLTASITGLENVLTLTRETHLLLLIAHAFGHRELSIRDVNDSFVLLSTTSNMDWVWLSGQIRANALEKMADLLFRWLKFIYPQLQIPSHVITRKHRLLGKEWPISLSWIHVLNQWRTYGSRHGSSFIGLREVMVLGWGTIAGFYLAEKVNSTNNSILEKIIANILFFRHKMAPFNYLVAPDLFGEVRTPVKLQVGQQMELLLQREGYKVDWDQEIHGMFVSVEEGKIVVLPCGIFLMSPNLLVGELLIERAMEIVATFERHLGIGKVKDVRVELNTSV